VNATAVIPPADAIAELMPHIHGDALRRIIDEHHAGVVCIGRRRFLVPRPARRPSMAERLVHVLPLKLGRRRPPC